MYIFNIEIIPNLNNLIEQANTQKYFFLLWSIIIIISCGQYHGCSLFYNTLSQIEIDTTE